MFLVYIEIRMKRKGSGRRDMPLFSACKYQNYFLNDKEKTLKK